MWDIGLLADRIAEIFRKTEAELRLEQAVYGLDARDERQLQELLAQRLSADYQVVREVLYPSHRLRCDLVLTPLGRPLKLENTAATLFDPPNPTPAAEALWVEMKAAWQFREGGVRHTGYGPQWRNAVVDDLRKMEAEPGIHHAALLLIVFNESPDVLLRDLESFENVLMEKEVLAGFGQTRSVAILERIGHRLCTAAIWPTIQR